MKITYGPWITAGDYPARWISGAKDGQWKPCSLDNKQVDPKKPRLLIDNRKGYKTVASKHKKNQYYCEECALRVYDLKYAPIMDKQEAFDLEVEQ